MTCPQSRAQLAAYQEGGLRPEQRRAVAAHLVSCTACRAELEAYEAGDRALRRLAAAAPTTTILQGVTHRLGHEDALRRRRRDHLRRSIGAWLNAAGMFGAAGVVGAVLVTLAQGVHPGASSGRTVVGAAAGDAASTAVKPRPAALLSHGDMSLLTMARLQTTTMPLTLTAPLVSRTRNASLLYIHTGDRTQFLQGNTEAPILRTGLYGGEQNAATVVPSPGIYTSLSVSPNGRWLAYGVYSSSRSSVWRGVNIRDVAAHTQAKVLRVPGDSPLAQIKGVRWAADNRHVIFSVLQTTQPKGSVVGYIGDASATGTPVKAYDGWWPAANQSLAPNLTLLARAGTGPDREYDNPITVGHLGAHPVWRVGRGAHPVWSPNSHRLAYLAGQRPDALTLWVVDVDGSNAHPLTVQPAQIGGVAWSPDGLSLAYAVDDGGKASQAGSQIFVVGADGVGPTLRGLRSRWVGDMAWAPTANADSLAR